MKKHFTKKRVALLAVLAVGAMAAVGAYAYFTSTGSGSGTATVGTAADNLAITLTVDGIGTKLYPAGPARAVTVDVSNPENFSQAVTGVFPDLTCDGNGGCDATSPGLPPTLFGCDPAWFHFRGDGSIDESTLATDDGSGSWDLAGGTNHDFAGAKVYMDDDGLPDQDACKNAHVTFWLSSN